jgi:hypothetical protein
MGLKRSESVRAKKTTRSTQRNELPARYGCMPSDVLNAHHQTNLLFATALLGRFCLRFFYHRSGFIGGNFRWLPGFLNRSFAPIVLLRVMMPVGQISEMLAKLLFVHETSVTKVSPGICIRDYACSSLAMLTGDVTRRYRHRPEAIDARAFWRSSGICFA